MTTYILDSSAVLAYLIDENGADEVHDLFLRARGKEVLLCMSRIQYGEVLYTIKRERPDLDFEGIKELIAPFPIKKIGITDWVTEIAALYKSKGGIAYPDCFVIATALECDGMVVTKDKEFKKFAEDIPLYWIGEKS